MVESIAMRSLRVEGTYHVVEPHYVLQQKLIILPPRSTYTSQLFTVKSTIMNIRVKSYSYDLWYNESSECPLEVKIARTVNAYPAPFGRNEQLPLARITFLKRGDYKFSIELEGSGSQPFEVRVLDRQLNEVGKLPSVRAGAGYEVMSEIENPKVCWGIYYEFYIVVRNLGDRENTIVIDAYLEESYDMITVEFLNPLIVEVAIMACFAVPIAVIIFRFREKCALFIALAISHLLDFLGRRKAKKHVVPISNSIQLLKLKEPSTTHRGTSIGFFSKNSLEYFRLNSQGTPMQPFLVSYFLSNHSINLSATSLGIFSLL